MVDVLLLAGLDERDVPPGVAGVVLRAVGYGLGVLSEWLLTVAEWLGV
jgi:hypothetical protein